MFGITTPSAFKLPAHPPGPRTPGFPAPTASRSTQPGATAVRPVMPGTPVETVQPFTNPTKCLPGSPASAALRRTGLALLLLALFLPWGIAQAGESCPSSTFLDPGAIPLGKGTCWVYTGQVEWLGQDQKEHRKVVKWRSEITDVIQREGVTAATLLGHPLDLAFYQEGRQPGRYVLVRDAKAKYYLLSNAAAEAFVNAMIKGQSPETLSEEDLILDGAHPMSTALSSPTDDGYNRWVNDGSRDFILKGIKGLRGGTVSSWRLSHRTNSSHMMASYVPAVGLVAFLYSHHGTLSRVDVRLVEYVQGGIVEFTKPSPSK